MGEAKKSTVYLPEEVLDKICGAIADYDGDSGVVAYSVLKIIGEFLNLDFRERAESERDHPQ